uniref:Spindle assembly checkpoint component MAD3 n=1 Tax=Lygus hesperus TaxID=30085 RepID=A0A0A9Y146_LYGHE
MANYILMEMSPIIDFDAFEDSKENIKPLRVGRDAMTLVKAVHSDSLEEIHVRYSQELQRYAGDDPLALWIQYIEAIQTYYTTGDSKRSRFVQTLESCLLEYRDDDRYRNDERFLKVWLLYTDSVTEPDDIYQFLLKNEICTQFSALYRSYAIYLLRRGQCCKANTIVVRGIECGAHPVRDLRLLLQHIQAAGGSTTTDVRSIVSLSTLRPLLPF